jgi:hypothetical protein
MLSISCKRLMLFLFVLLFLLPSQGWSQEMPDDKGDNGQILLWKTPNKPKLLPDISLIGSLAGAYFRDDPVGDQGENPSRTGFNFQGIEMALQSVVDPYIRADIFILFLEDGVEVEDATITTLSLPWNLQVRAGKMLPRFGRQITQHLEQIDFVDYSRVHRYFFGAEGFSELGVELSALLPTPWFSEISFEFLQGENEDNFNGTSKGDFSYLAHWKNALDLSQNVTLQTGLSGAFGENSTGAGNWTKIYGADLYLRWKPSAHRGLKWQTEYFYRRLQDVGTTHMDGGLNTQVLYQFARRFEGGLRFDGIGFPQDTLRQWSVSPVVTMLASEFFRLRGQYNLVHTADSNKEQHEAFLQLQFNIGSHGAHQF